MGALFGIIYIGVFAYIIGKVIKKNGVKGLMSNPDHRSPAHNAAMEAINKGAMAANGNSTRSQTSVDDLRTFEPVVSKAEIATSAARPVVTSRSDASPAEVFKTSFSHSGAMRKEAPVSRLMDDREHDWLAGQLREEKAAKRRMSAMFELKAEHAADCDAETLKRFHASNCDAEGVDTARA